MARSRNIKPGFFTNDLLAEIEPLGRILFAGLWTIADREGRLEDRPKRIKAQVLPYDDCSVDDLLNSLSDRGFIHRYQIGNEKYIQIVKWEKHQHPHVNESASTIPTPTLSSASTVQVPDKHQSDPSDSLLLIPDSLNPDKNSCRAKPDGVVPVKEIIAYLNEKTGKNFRATTKPYIAHIKARWGEGYRLNDFKKVVDIKLKDPHFIENPLFLRPETLFGTKFGSYLNQGVPQPPRVAL